MVTATAGFILSVISAVANGTFAAVAKLRRIQGCRPPLSPIILNCYVTTGVCICSVIIAIVLAACDGQSRCEWFVGDARLVWSWWGVLGGIIFVLSIACSFAAINLVGISVAQGVWCGSSICFSFLLGVTLLAEPVASVGLSVLAIFLLALGTTGMATCQALVAKFLPRPKTLVGISGTEPLDVALDGTITQPTAHLSQSRALGVLVALLVGLLGSLILLPAAFADKPAQGLGFVPSFAVGAAVGIAALTTAHHALVLGTRPLWHARRALLLGVGSGVIWAIGFVCTTLAFPAIGYAVAVPLMQTALVVSGLWGILVFREISDRRAVALFFAAAAVALGGAVLLSVYGRA